MNDGDIRGRTAMTAAERIVKRHGGKFSRGEWSSASGLTEGAAKALEAELLKAHFQVRPPQEGKDVEWTVYFR